MTTAETTRPIGRGRRACGRILEVAVIAVVVLADTLAFNQLSTQSPTDGIIQLSVVGVGFGGAFLAAALLVLPARRVERWIAPVVAVLAIATLIGWRARWPIGGAVIACAGSAFVWAVLGGRALARATVDPRESRASAIVTLAQASIFLWFAVLVAIDARRVLLG